MANWTHYENILSEIWQGRTYLNVKQETQLRVPVAELTTDVWWWWVLICYILKMEENDLPETLVSIYKTTWCHSNPDNGDCRSLWNKLGALNFCSEEERRKSLRNINTVPICQTTRRNTVEDHKSALTIRSVSLYPVPLLTELQNSRELQQMAVPEHDRCNLKSQAFKG